MSRLKFDLKILAVLIAALPLTAPNAATILSPDADANALPSLLDKSRNLSGEIRRKMDSIIRRVQTGNREAAIEELDAFLAEKPNNPLAVEIKATLTMEAGKLEEAEKLFERLIFLDPDSGSARGKYGAIKLRLGKTDEALTHLNRALVVDPHNAYTHNVLGQLEASRGNDDAAISHYQVVLAQVARSETVLLPLHVRTAGLLNRSNRADETVKLLSGRMAAAGNPGILQAAYLQLVAAHIQLKDEDGADKALKEAEKLFGAKDARIALARASLLQLQGDTAAAVKLLTAVKTKDPATQFRLHMVTAQLLREGKSHSLAAREYASALKIAEGSGRTPVVLRELSMTLLESGQRTEALKVLKDGVVKYPDQPTIAVTLASLEALTGDRGEALKRLAETAKAHPKFAPARDLRAQLLLASGKKREAYAELKAATQLAPRNIGYWIARSELAHDVEGHDAVQKVLKEGLIANPGQPDLMYDLALIDNEEGRKSDANRQFESILRANPNHVPTMISLSENLATDTKTREQALRIAQRARDLKPGDPFTQNGYGWVLHLAGKTEQGLPALEATAASLPRQAIPKYRLAVVYAALGRKSASRRLARQALRLGLHGPEKKAAQKLSK